MTYASTSIDRRAAYYARAADLIAADPLDFYTRAEKGRRFLASRLNRNVDEHEQVVARYLSDVVRRTKLPMQYPAPLLTFRELARLHQ